MNATDSLRRYCARGLEALVVERYLSEGTPKALIAVWLVFGDAPGVRLEGTSYGWGLEMSGTRPEPVEMAEYGATEVVDVSAEWDIVGERVTSIKRSVTPDISDPYGVVFEFGADRRLWIYNWDDELYMTRDGPPWDPRVELIPVCGA